MSTRRLALLAAALLACVALAACSPPPSAPTLRLVSADGGTTKSVAPGTTIKIALDANPTTGYSWAVDGTLPAQLAEQGQPTYRASTPGVVGASGMQTLTFKAVSAGDAALRLKYARSFEPTAAPPATFSITIHVQ